MGKGFNNYMCKKFFHPASRDNLKRVWMAEQQTESYKKKQEELRVQYEKEQDLYTNKAIMSKESKEKLSVNFLYEPPPGTKKDREREDDEPEFKFEWQRKYNAPRESYCKGDQEIRDQPFGIQVRNVRCIKCHKWGHINTDKECPMYNQAAGGTEASSNLNPSELIRQMREDGLAMKKGAVGLLELPSGPSGVSNQQLIPSSSEDEDHMNETELKFLEGLSTKKKLKLLRKLEKMEKKKKKRKKEKERKEGSKKRKDGEDDTSDSDSDSPTSRKKKKKAAKSSFDWAQNAPDKSLHNRIQIKQENGDMEQELFTVLGRKMDFEGLPQSRTHSKDVKKYDQRIKEEPDNSRRNRHAEAKRRSRSPENGHRNRSASPTKPRTKHDKSSRGRERSTSRDKSRKRSSSRSKETRRRSRSPSQKERHYHSNQRHH